MSDENSREVFRAHRDAQTRYIYFLLAGAGAAIGFAVTQTQTARLGWSHAPLGIAVLCWAVSFYCGCRHLGYVISGLYANHAMIGGDPSTDDRPAVAALRVKTLAGIIESPSNQANRYAQWQFRSLLVGAGFFIAWHVLQMYLRAG